mmetsp:Transcript_91169/g.202439  ORF Transcript_91169/g.202439 Transcript_91169/m.202439 type:complete len:255 (+) Transcript_91169:156-920(+)
MLSRRQPKHMSRNPRPLVSRRHAQHPTGQPPRQAVRPDSCGTQLSATATFRQLRRRSMRRLVGSPCTWVSSIPMRYWMSMSTRIATTQRSGWTTSWATIGRGPWSSQASNMSPRPLTSPEMLSLSSLTYPEMLSQWSLWSPMLSTDLWMVRLRRTLLNPRPPRRAEKQILQRSPLRSMSPKHPQMRLQLLQRVLLSPRSATSAMMQIFQSSPLSPRSLRCLRIMLQLHQRTLSSHRSSACLETQIVQNFPESQT